MILLRKHNSSGPNTAQHLLQYIKPTYKYYAKKDWEKINYYCDPDSNLYLKSTFFQEVPGLYTQNWNGTLRSLQLFIRNNKQAIIVLVSDLHSTLTHFTSIFYFYTPLKESENLWFSDVSRGNRNGTLV